MTSRLKLFDDYVYLPNTNSFAGSKTTSLDLDPDIRSDSQPTLHGRTPDPIADPEDNLEVPIDFEMDIDMEDGGQRIHPYIDDTNSNSTLDMDEDIGSSVAEQSDSGTEEDDICLEDLNAEDLIHTLQQKYSDDWQQKLHEFRV